MQRSVHWSGIIRMKAEKHNNAGTKLSPVPAFHFCIFSFPQNSTYLYSCKGTSVLLKDFFLFPIPVHQADNIQKQVDKVQIHLQRGKYRCFLKKAQYQPILSIIFKTIYVTIHSNPFTSYEAPASFSSTEAAHSIFSAH